MKTKTCAPPVFVHLDQSFGDLRETQRGKALRIVGAQPSPATATALERLLRAGSSWVAIAPQHASRACLDAVRASLPGGSAVRASARTKRTVTHCRRIVGRAVTPILVSADRVIRGEAKEAKARPAPHVSIAAMWVEGHQTQFVELRAAKAQIRQLADFVPYHVRPLGGDKVRALGVVTRSTAAKAVSMGIQVNALDLDIGLDDPLLVRLDNPHSDCTVKALSDRRVLASWDSEVLLALGPNEPTAALDIHGQHGHFVHLSPMPGLLDPPKSPDLFEQLEPILRIWPNTELVAIPPLFFDPPCTTDAAMFQSDVDRYSGVATLDSTGTIASRHVDHPDNTRVVSALVSDLNAMGYCAYTHSFSYNGQIRKNVLADLPGRGYIFTDWPWLDRLRDLLIGYPLPLPPIDWLPKVEALLGKETLKKANLYDHDPLVQRRALERLALLDVGYPWWWDRKLCLQRLPGPGAKIVLIGCHLDSTAASGNPSYDSTTDPAPGADDDASGIAAVLAAARYMKAYQGQLTHTVRFCFFNAEEVGIIGSRAYAQKLKTENAPVKVAICADMVGWNTDSERIFEVHAGYWDGAIRDASVPFAQKVVDAANTLGQLDDGQIYQGTAWGTTSQTDRLVIDPAIERSDHVAFHEQGWPAVVVSEDFFVNQPGEPAADGNPNYHRAVDTSIDADYGADIACALSLAVCQIANSW